MYYMVLSSSKFFSLLDNVNINLGTTLAIIIVGGGLIFNAYKSIKKYNEVLKNKLKNEEETEKTLNSVNDLVTSVNTLKDEIVKDRSEHEEYRNTINNKLDSLTRLIEQERELSRKGDEEIKNQMSILSDKVDVVDKKSNLLIESDKEGIKGNITEKYYKAMKDGYIEIHTLETLEAQYEKYLEENGNTFVSGLMEALRALPHTEPVRKSTSRKRTSTSAKEGK